MWNTTKFCYQEQYDVISYQHEPSRKRTTVRLVSWMMHRTFKEPLEEPFNLNLWIIRLVSDTETLYIEPLKGFLSEMTPRTLNCTIKEPLKSLFKKNNNKKRHGCWDANKHRLALFQMSKTTGNIWDVLQLRWKNKWRQTLKDSTQNPSLRNGSLSI